MPVDESSLILAAQADKTEFVALYDLHIDKIHRFILSRVSDPELAQDFTSETFMKCLENIDRYTYTGKPFSAWLYRIAINLINDHYRAHKKERALMEQEWREIGEKFDAADKDAKSREEAEEQHAHVQNLNLALQKLKPYEQDIVTLKYFEDLSYKEIADTLGISVSNVGVKLTRALNKLSQFCNVPTP